MKILNEILAALDMQIELEDNEELIVDQQVKSICLQGDTVVITLPSPLSYSFNHPRIVIQTKPSDQFDSWYHRVSNYLAGIDDDEIDLTELSAYIINHTRKEQEPPTRQYLKRILQLLGWQPSEKERNIFLRPARQQRPSQATKKC